MVTIYNKSNRPIGIAGQSVLPTKEIRVKDRDVYCAVYDENGVDTGKKEILPGLTAMEIAGFITIKPDEEAKPVAKVEAAVEKPAEVEKAVEVEAAEDKPKRKYGKKKTEE